VAELEAADQALQMAHELRNARLAAEANFWRGNTLLMLGRLEEGQSTLEAALPGLAAAPDVLSQDLFRRTHFNLYSVLVSFSHWDDDQDHLDQALQVAERLGDQRGVDSK
jgi:hypothetical protein